jgi:TATA-box binding protein (TBP) (component of TFIID and TFIIIB)
MASTSSSSSSIMITPTGLTLEEYLANRELFEKIKPFGEVNLYNTCAWCQLIHHESKIPFKFTNEEFKEMASTIKLSAGWGVQYGDPFAEKVEEKQPVVSRSESYLEMVKRAATAKRKELRRRIENLRKKSAGLPPLPSRASIASASTKKKAPKQFAPGAIIFKMQSPKTYATLYKSGIMIFNGSRLAPDALHKLARKLSIGILKVMKVMGRLEPMNIANFRITNLCASFTPVNAQIMTHSSDLLEMRFGGDYDADLRPGVHVLRDPKGRGLVTTFQNGKFNIVGSLLLPKLLELSLEWIHSIVQVHEQTLSLENLAKLRAAPAGPLAPAHLEINPKFASLELPPTEELISKEQEELFAALPLESETGLPIMYGGIGHEPEEYIPEYWPAGPTGPTIPEGSQGPAAPQEEQEEEEPMPMFELPPL